ncbi:MAG: nicotinate-nucleotide adenylyltransferase [Gammaproteobacteria bacterium]
MTDAATTAPLGLLGGTFDPVHLGHLRLAIEVREALALAEVRLLPAAQTNLRDAARASAAQREAMLRATLADCAGAGLALDTRELARGGVSYTIDTLAAVRAEIGARPLCFILGADAWNALPRWQRWRALLDYAHFVVASRPGATLVHHVETAAAWTEDRSALLSRPAGHVIACPIPLLPISSTDIRVRVAAGRCIDALVAPGVAALIARAGLYGAG